MGDIISRISGQISRSWILGSLLPSLLFFLICLASISISPTYWRYPAGFKASGEWQIVGFTGATLILSGLLYNLNVLIIRYFEGYPWKKSWWGCHRTKHYRRRLKRVQTRYQGLRTLHYANRTHKYLENDPNLAEAKTVLDQQLMEAWSEAGSELNTKFPGDPSLVLPTCLGNVIRSFEYYSTRQYGIDAIVIWPRLVSVVDKDFAGTIDDAKTSFDFMLNSCVLSAVLVVGNILLGLVFITPTSPPRLLPLCITQIALFVWVTSLTYGLAVNRAMAWGNAVKSAFDLYRWDLLRKMGFTELPTTMGQERLLWNNICRRIQYGDSPRAPLPVYVPLKKMTCALDSNGSELRVLRMVRARRSGGFSVTLYLRNHLNVSAPRVCVTDTLAEGFALEEVVLPTLLNPNHISLTASEPVTFEIAELQIAEAVELKYTIVAMPR